MEIVISFPGGKRVDASFDGLTVHTDQPAAAGGSGSAAAPFDLFLASLATCAGYYILAYCQTRGLATDGIELVQRHTLDAAGKHLERVDLDLRLPADFPEKHRVGVVRAADHCKVKKLLEHPPVVAVTVHGAPADSGRPAAA
jgi:ribosomal protein S12 methylthiotransferase accessory factor